MVSNILTHLDLATNVVNTTKKLIGSIRMIVTRVKFKGQQTCNVFCNILGKVAFSELLAVCFMRLFVCGSLACWSILDYGLLVLAWMLLYASFQFKIFSSQMMVILRYCHLLN